MTCREFIEFLWRYVAGELDREQRLRFDGHLAVCPACVDYLRTYEETVRLGNLFAATPDDPVPDEVPRELLAAVLDTVRFGAGAAPETSDDGRASKRRPHDGEAGNGE